MNRTDHGYCLHMHIQHILLIKKKLNDLNVLVSPLNTLVKWFHIHIKYWFLKQLICVCIAVEVIKRESIYVLIPSVN